MKKISSLCMLVLLVACAPRLEPLTSESTPAETRSSTPPPAFSKTVTPSPTRKIVTSTIKATRTPTPMSVFCLHLLRPDRGTNLPDSGRVTFEWERQAGAQYYVLTLSLPNGSRQTSQTEETHFTRFVKTLATSDPYEWSVTAYDAKSRRICDSGTFTLFPSTRMLQGTKMATPTFIVPPTVFATPPYTKTFIAPPTPSGTLPAILPTSYP